MRSTARTPAQRAAWDAYLAVTAGLLPALNAKEIADGGTVNPQLGGVAIRIRRYAPMWGDDGPILIAATHSAVRLYRAGDRPAMTALLHTMAHRLFALSAARAVPRQRGSNDPPSL
jgi:hypothetical protein